MARRRNRQPLVPGTRQELDRFKGEVMKSAGYPVDPDEPNRVKYEVARTLGVPLTSGYNGNLTTEDAGKVGGQIGGRMVREMIRMAQNELNRKI